MTRRSLATLLVVGLALVGQLSVAVFHAPSEPACSAASASVEAQAEHEEEVVQDVAWAPESTVVRRWRPAVWQPALSAGAAEILHVPRA